MKRAAAAVVFLAVMPLGAQVPLPGSGGGGAGGTIGSATPGDIAVYGTATSIGGETGAGLLKYAGANTNYATPLLLLDNPATGTAETIAFRVAGVERGRISQNALGGMVISSDIQGAGSSNLVISTFDVGAASTNRLQLCTNCGSGGIANLNNGDIVAQSSADILLLPTQAVSIIGSGVSLASQISTDRVQLDVWEANTANPPATVRIRNGSSAGAAAGTGDTFQIVNTTLNSPALLYRNDAAGRPHAPTDASTTVGTCGTSPSIVGNDAAGRVTTGSSATTSCTVTFHNLAVTWNAAPFCVATSAGAVPGVVAVQAVSSTTTLVLTYASATSAVITYHCIGN